MHKKYEIGYGKPPTNSRFQKGQSGNPTGRKKGSKSFAASVREVSQKKIRVKTPEGFKFLTLLEASVWNTFLKAASGDPKAIRTMMDMQTKFPPEMIPQPTRPVMIVFGPNPRLDEHGNKMYDKAGKPLWEGKHCEHCQCDFGVDEYGYVMRKT